jgi:serine/threonine-protein kinase
MAPEQAAADPSTDHRADIYSFGCLAFELFTGRAPFHDLPIHSVVAAHADTVAPPVTALRADVPPAVGELIARCLEKNPAARPQTARDLLTALDGASVVNSPAPSILGVPYRWAGLALVVGAIGLGVYVATRAGAGSAPLTLAVLPFSNIGADRTVDFVADGLADEIGGALARVPGIQVKSRIGARSYQGQPTVDVAEAGVRLAVDYLMSGKFHQERGHWILSADLTRAADSTTIWGEAFDLGPDEQVRAAEEIAASLVTALRNRFPRAIGAAPVLAPNQRAANGEALRLYMSGNERLNRRSQSVKESADFFRRAIRQDSLYAKAYSGLSMALSLFPNYHGVSVNTIQAEMVRAARRALDLDPTLAQPHVALAKVHEFDWQWDSAEAELKTAIRLDGHLAEAHNQYARLLRNRGRFPAALIQLRAARADDPATAPIMSQLSYLYYLDGQLDSALVESQRALENDPASRTTVALGALVRLANHRPEEARKLIDRASQTSPFIAYVIARTGDTATARQRLREQDAQTPPPGFAETRRSYTYLGLGDTANALSALERATDAREVWPSTLSVYDPLYDPIRQSVRFKALLRRVGLAP